MIDVSQVAKHPRLYQGLGILRPDSTAASIAIDQLGVIVGRIAILA